MKQKALGVLSALLCAYFALNGILKLVSHAHMVESFAGWGYGRAFMWLIGFVELAAAIALVIPRAASLGALALFGVMVGATFTHVTHAEWAHALIPLGVMPLLVFVGIGRRPR